MYREDMFYTLYLLLICKIMPKVRTTSPTDDYSEYGSYTKATNLLNSLRR